ncbi:MAG: cytochrome b/b6 domain-containing protein [Candidatus Methanoperedens sp.]|nr:cytochrome b/b6 domain-containing protein [Candidatus Methanoperedens sp.]
MTELKFKRFTLNQRIQHIIFFASFILLAYTGFPLKFPDEWWSGWMIASVGGFDNRTLIHHYSGLVMIGVSIYHVIYHVIIEKPRFDVLFNLKDVQDFKQQMMYFLRYTNEHPRFGRYAWKQKFEYFGAGFGAVVMGVTGLILWYPFEVMKYLPLAVVQISYLFHTWEAVLASLAVFIGHFYDEHFGKFPNMSWITGNIPEEEIKHEHRAEYEDIMRSLEAEKSIK